MPRLRDPDMSGGELSQESDDAMIAKARSLRPLLAANAQKHEDQGKLSPEVVAALSEAGFWKMPVPRRWGGLTTSASAMLNVYIELSKGCPSTSWVLAIMNGGILTAARMSAASQKEVFSKGIPRAAGASAPTGKARGVAGGYVVNGAWTYASGSYHADWFLAAATEPDGGEKSGGMFIAPASEFTIEHTWNTAGLKGTGSETIRATDLFVPAHRMMLYKTITERGSPDSHYDEITDHWTMVPMVRAAGIGVLIGMLEGLLEVVIGDNSKRPLAQTKFRRKSDSAVFVAGIGEAASKIFAAKALMEKTMAEIDALAIEKRQMSYSNRVLNRGFAAISVRLLREAADGLVDALGSSGFLTANIGQRYWRDFSTGVRHVSFLSDPGMEVFGRALLGVPIEDNITPPSYV
jgi:3-hydroxy-9,10-secoandrosta-1,3,5(10)-triene-9,17-dione monooxygenase